VSFGFHFSLVKGMAYASAAVDMYVVHYLDGAGGVCHTSGRPFVLGDVGMAFPGNDAILNADLESVLANLGFCELDTDRLLNFGVVRAGAGMRGGSGGSEGGRAKKNSHQKDRVPESHRDVVRAGAENSQSA